VTKCRVLKRRATKRHSAKTSRAKKMSPETDAKIDAKMDADAKTSRFKVRLG
jgi:hypothetical protein